MPDPAAAARIEALEKSVAALRGELAARARRTRSSLSALNDVKSAPRSDGAASPDLSAINERIAKVESQMRAQSAEIAQQGSKLADSKAAEAKPADDMPLRRVVAAALLDVLVRTGDPYPAALAAAKSLAPNADALKPLDQFADDGRAERRQAEPRIAGAGAESCRRRRSGHCHDRFGHRRAVAGGRRKTGPHRAHRHRGNDRGAVVARVTAAALRNDFNEARRELKTLEPADRAAAQGWLEKADARDAALAASRQFAADAMAALAKPAQ